MTETVQAGAIAPAAGACVLGWFAPGSPEWHAARAAGIGGSEIAAVLGLSPHESRFSLWHRKKGMVAPVEETDVMYWGKLHEPTICSEFGRRHPGWDVRQAPTYGRGIQIANPDRELFLPDGTVELLEAKTSRDDEHWGEPGTDEIPVHYRAQCLWYCDVRGARRCHVAVLIGLSDYREYVVEYDPAEAALMRDAAIEFVRTVEADERPSIDGHAATYQTLRDLPEGLDAVDVEIPTALRDRFHAAQDAAWAAEDELTACKGELLDRIGTGQRAVCERQRIATRTVRDGHTYQLLPARTRRTAQ
ncbi:YqaJ viral recombinase family protein [Streptomyces roseus]|uniref:YqaJ viral recombinase family nuclease n=1 Tax=Streptomyces roseus TaxID=66430 RepID=UPI0037FEBB8C